MTQGSDTGRVTVTLRPVRDDDYSFMRALYGDYRAEEMKHFPFDDQQREQFLDQQFAAQTEYYREHYPGSQCSIIECDGIPVGRFFVDPRRDEIRIMDIALVSEARNLGIGTQLIRGVLATGARSGRRVTIHVEAYNQALRLYERMGFRRIDTNGVYYLLEWRAG